jgi:hypothetical protein
MSDADTRLRKGEAAMKKRKKKSRTIVTVNPQINELGSDICQRFKKRLGSQVGWIMLGEDHTCWFENRRMPETHRGVVLAVLYADGICRGSVVPIPGSMTDELWKQMTLALWLAM